MSPMAYRCDKCPAKFLQMENLYKHVREVHPRAIEPPPALDLYSEQEEKIAANAEAAELLDWWDGHGECSQILPGGPSSHRVMVMVHGEGGRYYAATFTEAVRAARDHLRTPAHTEGEP
jgi:hypothetical protein